MKRELDVKNVIYDPSQYNTIIAPDISEEDALGMLLHDPEYGVIYDRENKELYYVEPEKGKDTDNKNN